MKKYLRPLFLILPLLAGCAAVEQGATDMVLGMTDYLAGEDNANPPNELLPLSEEFDLELLWKRSIGEGSGKQRVALVPALFLNKAVAASRDGKIEAFGLEEGEKLWEVETELALSGGPGKGYDALIVGTSDGEVLALEEENGNERWRTTVSSEVLSVPQVASGVVIIRTVDGRITALSEDDGRQLWFYERDVPALSLRGTSSPLIWRNLVIDGYASGKLVGLRLNDGRVVWETSIAIPSGRTELDRIVDIDADPVIDGDVIYIASYQAGVSAMSLETGELLWGRREVSSYAGMAAGWRYLFVTDEKSQIWAMDMQSGVPVWKQDELLNRGLTAPTIIGDYLVVGDFEGYMHWFSQDDGRQVARIRVANEPILAKPVVDSETVYIFSKDGKLAAVSRR